MYYSHRNYWARMKISLKAVISHLNYNHDLCPKNKYGAYKTENMPHHWKLYPFMFKRERVIEIIWLLIVTYFNWLLR